MKLFQFEKPRVLPRFSNVRPCRTAAARTVRGLLCSALLAMLIFAGSVCAQERPQERPNAPGTPEAIHYGWADVLRVDPIFEESAEAAGSNPQQECYEEQVLIQPAQANEPDQGKRVGGTLLGAIIGGVIGSRFGKGDGRKAATAAGAVAGGAIGNNLASGDGNTPAGRPARYTTQRRCRQVEGAQRHAIAYDVEYRYRGEVYTARMATDPGDRMRVKVSVTPAE
jgi:uncharacterized protein YcfJ